ncbi:MAG TPA: AAA family ATPase, partial [Ktedonobacteraceae bacterium]|nr:AAA family ATPase [Ktedonobacteraceae bacterium]
MARKRTKHTDSRQETDKQSPRPPTFLLELPLVVDEGQAKRLRAHLEVGRQLYNALLSEGQRCLRRMR